MYYDENFKKPKKKKERECKFCGDGPLIWTKTDDGWRLMDPDTEEVHECDGKGDIDSEVDRKIAAFNQQQAFKRG